MGDKIIILAGILGLDVNSKADSKFIMYCINGIDDLDAFIEYCDDKKDSIEYVKKNERLNILAKQYKKLEEEAREKKMIGDSRTYAQKLSDKVHSCRSFVDSKGIHWKNVAVNGEKLFEDHEIRALDSLGSVEYIIEMSRSGELKEIIEYAYQKRKRKKKSYEKLEYNGEKVRHLIGNMLNEQNRNSS